MRRKHVSHLFLTIGITACVGVGFLGCKSKEPGGDEQVRTLRIGVGQYIHHPALDMCREGFEQEAKRLGLLGEGVGSTEYQNAQGDPATAQSIAAKFAAGGYDLVFALGTPMAQAVQRAVKESSKPVVFGAITDPVSAGLADAMEAPGNNMTGTSDQWPYFAQVELFRKVLPDARRLCVVLNPGEDNTRYAMKQTRDAASKLGVELVEAPVTSTSEVFEAAGAVSARCDAFYVPADNTAMAAAPTIVRVANRRGIPVIAGDPATFEAGALVGLGVSYRDLGVQSARLAAEILLKDVAPGDLPVVTSQAPELWVNLEVARDLGINIPDEVLSQASLVIGAEEESDEKAA